MPGDSAGEKVGAGAAAENSGDFAGARPRGIRIIWYAGIASAAIVCVQNKAKTIAMILMLEANRRVALRKIKRNLLKHSGKIGLTKLEPEWVI